MGQTYSCLFLAPKFIIFEIDNVRNNALKKIVIPTIPASNVEGQRIESFSSNSSTEPVYLSGNNVPPNGIMV